MGLEEIISESILNNYPAHEECTSIRIRRHSEVNVLVDQVLNLKPRDCFKITTTNTNNEIRTFIAIVKKHHDENGPEYQQLTKHWIQYYKGKQRYKIPMPVCWVPGHKILVVEMADGILLSHALGLFLLPGIYFFSKHYLDTMLALSVDWLIDFQKYTLSNVLYDFNKLYVEVIQKLQSISNKWKVLAEILVDAVDVNRLSALAMPQVDWHGDFLHRNIIISRHVVTVFDWEGHWKFNELHPLFEPFRFAFSLLLLNRRPIYHLGRLIKVARFALSRYLNGSFINIDYLTCRSIYHLFLVQMVFYYDNQINGLCIGKNKKNSELIKKIVQIDLKELVDESSFKRKKKPLSQ